MLNQMMNATTRAERVTRVWQEICGDVPYGSLIDGRVQRGEGDSVTILDPASGDQLLQYPDAGERRAREAARAADWARQAWYRDMTAAQRGRVMWQAAQRVRDNIEQLAELEALSAGKPIRDTRVEATKVAEMFEYYAGWCDKLYGQVIPVPTSHLNYTQRVPHGVVAQVTPWNAPIFTGGWQIAPALAAGNTVVIKPSELTPLSTVALGCLLLKAGVPSGAVNVLAGFGGTTGAAMFAAPEVHLAVFVGSPETGRVIARTAADRLIPCILELGGKSANVVFDDADLAKAAGGAAAGIYAAAGQSCVAGSRLLVQKSVYEDVLGRLTEKARSLQMGAPEDPETQVGPLNGAAQQSRVLDYIEKARQAGARVLCGGKSQAPGHYVEPTVIADVQNDWEIAQEEIFGPVVVAMPFEDEAEAVRLTNQTRFGLAGAVWSGRVERAHRVAGQIEAGTVWINGYKTIGVMSPFGGFKESGFGRSSGHDALMEYTRARSIWTEISENPAMAFGY